MLENRNLLCRNVCIIKPGPSDLQSEKKDGLTLGQKKKLKERRVEEDEEKRRGGNTENKPPQRSNEQAIHAPDSDDVCRASTE